MVNSFSFLSFFLWLPQDSTILVLPNHVSPLLPLTLEKKSALVIHCHKVNYLQTSWLKMRNIILFLFPMVLDVDCLIGGSHLHSLMQVQSGMQGWNLLRTYSGMSGS